MKKIKLIKHFALWITAIVILFVAALLLSGDLQTFMAKALISKLSTRSGTEIRIGRFEAKMLKDYNLSDFLILDQSGDTLAYFKNIRLVSDSLSFSGNSFGIHSLELEAPVIKIERSKAGYYNYEFLTDLFGETDDTSDSSDFVIVLEHLKIIGGRFEYQDLQTTQARSHSIFSSSDMAFRDIRADIGKLSYAGDLSFDARHISFRESCGFTTDSLNFSIGLKSHLLTLRDLNWHTPFSEIHIPAFRFMLPISASRSARETSREEQYMLIAASKINGRDPAFFTEYLRGNTADLFLSASAYKFRDRYVFDFFNLSSSAFRFTAGGTVSDDFQSDKFSASVRINRLYADKSAAQELRLKNIFGKSAVLPPELQDLEFLDARGELLYLPDSLVLSAKVNSNIFESQIALTLIPGGQFTAAETNIRLQFIHPVLALAQHGLKAEGLEADVSLLMQSEELHTAAASTLIIRPEYQNFILQNLYTKFSYQKDKYKLNITADDSSASFAADLSVDTEEEENFYNFFLDARHIILPKPSGGGDRLSLSGRAEGQITGRLPYCPEGYIGLSDFSFSRGNKTLPLSALIIKMSNEYGQQIFEADSEFGRIDFRSTMHLPDLYRQLQVYPEKFVSKPTADTAVELSKKGIANFTADLEKMKALNDFFFPEYNFGQKMHLEFFFNAETNIFELSTQIPDIVVKDISLSDFSLDISGSPKRMLITALTSGRFFDDGLPVERLYFESRLKKGRANSVLSWFSDESAVYAGDLSVETRFNSEGIFNTLMPTSMLVQGRAWELSGGSVNYSPERIDVSALSLLAGESEIEINGQISENPEVALNIDFYNIRLDKFKNYYHTEGLDFRGLFQGKLALYNLYNRPAFDLAAYVHALHVNNYDFGDLSLTAEHDSLKNLTRLNAFAFNGDNRLSLEGSVNNFETLDFRIGIPELDMRVLHDLFKENLDIYGGRGSGNLQIYGSVKQPSLNGVLRADKLKTRIHYLGTEYEFSPVIALTDSSMEIFKTPVTDSYNNSGTVSAKIHHRGFDDFSFELDMAFDRFLVLNTGPGNNPDYYGRVFAGGNAGVSGTFSNFRVDADIFTLPGTELVVSTGEQSIREEHEFIRFSGVSDTLGRAEKSTELSENMLLNMHLQIAPEAKFEIITDPITDDRLTFSGKGNLAFKTGSTGNIELTGVYEISQGEYDFNLDQYFGYKFNIVSGSSIRWKGLPEEATADIEARFPVKQTELYDFFQDENYRNDYLTVNCQIFIENNLMKPDISFGLAPDEDHEILESVLKNMEDDELNKQFVSLLLLKKFQPMPGLRRRASETTDNEFDASALVAKQIGPLLSSLNENLDVGLKYNRPKEQIGSEVELDISAGLLNNRLRLTGNLAHGEYENLPHSKTVGDFELIYKLRADGRFRLKIFNVYNRNLMLHSAPYTQGFGLFLKSESDRFFGKDESDKH